MYVAVCDDDAAELASIDSLLCEWEARQNISLRRKLFSSAVELLEVAPHEGFTLYLLDVMMPGLSGMNAARELRTSASAVDIVFLASSPEFAWESYRVQALDYLLKPVDKVLLFSILDRLYQSELRSDEVLTLKARSGIFCVSLSSISFVEVLGKRLFFNLADGKTIEVAGPLKLYEEQLLSRLKFVHCHRSYIVNLRYVEHISSSFIRTHLGNEVPVSRSFYSQLKHDYMKFIFEGGEER